MSRLEAQEDGQSAPTAQQVEAEVARVLSAAPFRDAPQLKAFLLFIVRETLAGRGGDLKGYSIATLALGRSDSFDPQTDPIVRVQAGRLRQALAEHYDAQPDSAVMITLERGSYEPRFVLSAPKQVSNLMADDSAPALQSSSSQPAVKPDPANSITGERRSPVSARNLAMVAGILFVGMLTTTWFLLGWQRSVKPKELPYSAFVPTLIVETESQGMGSELGILAARARDSIARFDDIVVVQDHSDLTAALGGGGDAKPRTRITLKIVGSVAGPNQMRVSARLIDHADQKLLWSREYDPVPLGPSGDKQRSTIVQSIAASIAQPYGIIHTHVRAQSRVRFLMGDPYDCIVASFDYWLSNDAASHLAARQCLEDRLSVYPNTPPLHAFMTYLHLEEHRQGYNPLPGNALDRALQSAQLAVQLAPASARSHQALLAAHFARNEKELAWQAAGKAMELNPNDTEIMEDVGARHVQSGNYEKGLELLQRSLDLNNAPPTWAVTFRAIALYMLGRTDQSSPIAITLRGSNYGLAMVAVVMAAADRGNIEEAEASYDRLFATHPAITNDLPAYLKKLVFDEKTAGQINADFERAKAFVARNRK